MSSQGGDNNIHFFKVILESSLRDGELRVPKGFVKKYWEEVSKSNPVVLRLPNSTEWKVYWMRRDGDVWLRNGWKEFANYLSLEKGQFLVFEYEQKSHFKVIALGTNDSEIKYPSTNKEGEAVNESDCSFKIVNDFSAFEGKRPSSQACKKMKSNLKKEPEWYSILAETKREKKEFHADDLKVIDDMSKALFENVKKIFRSESPFFICRCQRTYAERDLLIIPKDFGQHLDNKEGPATLVYEERTWDVIIKYKQLSICEGWKKFFQDNKMKLGDVCAFVLHKDKGVSFEVEIFRLGDDYSSTPLSEDQEDHFHKPSSFTSNPETPKANSRCMSKNVFTLYFSHITSLHYVNIPIDFIRNCISHTGKNVTFRFEKRSWPVKLLC